MAQKDVLQQMISELGQSQDERAQSVSMGPPGAPNPGALSAPGELHEHYADVDERTPEEQLARMKALAARVLYSKGESSTPDGTWEGFFPDSADIPRLFAGPGDGATPPHLALWMTFLKLLETPREALNRITGLHRDYHYQTLLGFEPAPAVPDRAHVVVQLKPKQTSLLLGPEHELSAGKDAAGVDIVYSPVRATIVNRSRVTHLSSVLVENRTAKRGRVRFAPIANSADGVGAPLPETNPAWSAFGHDALPDAKVGFAIAAPVLRMAEGARTVTIAITLVGWSGQGPTAAAIAGALRAFITGPEGWIGPLSAQGTRSGSALSLTLKLGAGDAAVVDHDRAIHGGEYRVSAPVVQLLFGPGDDGFGYSDVRGLAVGQVRVSVLAEEVSSLGLENNVGRLDATKVFLPFGPEPRSGSRLVIDCPEIRTKKLSALGIHLVWHGLPESLDDTYSTYTRVVSQDSFTASVTFSDAGGWQGSYPRQRLFGRGDGKALLHEQDLSYERAGSAPLPRTSASAVRQALERTGATWGKADLAKMAVAAPGFFFEAREKSPSLEFALSSTRGVLLQGLRAAPGRITITLDRDFLHGDYRRMIVERTLAYGRGQVTAPVLPLEPYTPALQSISLSYEAHSDDVDMSADSESAFATEEVQLFHVGCLGVVREHRYSRERLGLTDTTARLVPTYTGADSIASGAGHTDGGELWIGLSDLSPGQSVSLLFQVAEGSADPDLPRRKLAWSVLREDHFQPVEIALDTTNNLLRSGLVVVVLPTDASTTGTFLPSNRIWLCAALAGGVGSVCQILAVEANGVEVQRRTGESDLAQLSVPLPNGSLKKLKTPVAGVQSVTQPFASFGGCAAETNAALATRASERLRHKGRCVTAWDYERVVLAAFPEIHRVKCVPHACGEGFFAPGHVLLVVVPDLRIQNAKDRLRPKVDADTLLRIQDYLVRRAGMGAQIHVHNPRYEEVKLSFKVRFRPGVEADYHVRLLDRELQEYLSPWAFEIGRDMPFGGRVHRSTLLRFVESRAYVDHVTDVRLYTSPAGQTSTIDVAEAIPERPDAILVSSAAHDIHLLPGE